MRSQVKNNSINIYKKSFKDVFSITFYLELKRLFFWRECFMSLVIWTYTSVLQRNFKVFSVKYDNLCPEMTTNFLTGLYNISLYFLKMNKTFVHFYSFVFDITHLSYNSCLSNEWMMLTFWPFCFYFITYSRLI